MSSNGRKTRCVTIFYLSPRPGRSASGTTPSRCRRTAGLALALAGLALSGLALPGLAGAQEPDLSQVPPYKPEFHVVGRLRIAGSPLKGLLPLLMEGFQKAQPEALVSGNYMTESEGALGNDVSPVCRTSRRWAMMPRSPIRCPSTTPSATHHRDLGGDGCYNQRGCLYAWAIMVNKDNPLAHLSMQQLDEIFGSSGPARGRWAGRSTRFSSPPNTRAAPEPTSAPGDSSDFKGGWARKEIQTWGYVAPGFAVSFERHVMHWSDKWYPNFHEVVEQKEATPDVAGQKVWSERMYEAVSKDSM